MSFNVFSLESAKHLFYMELVKQFTEKGYQTPQTYVKIEGTIDDVAVNYIRQGDQQVQIQIDKSGRQSKLFYVIKKAMINKLGMTDWVTYFVMYSKKWYKSWAKEDNMDIKKYRGQDGILFRAPDKLFNYHDTTPFMSALVVITTEPKLEINYCKISDLKQELTKDPHKYKVFNKDGLEKSGAPKSIFKEEDVF